MVINGLPANKVRFAHLYIQVKMSSEEITVNVVQRKSQGPRATPVEKSSS